MLKRRWSSMVVSSKRRSSIRSGTTKFSSDWLLASACASWSSRSTPSLLFEVRDSTYRNFAVLFRIASSALSQKVSPPIYFVRSHQTLNRISPRRSVSQSANVLSSGLA